MCWRLTMLKQILLFICTIISLNSHAQSTKLENVGYAAFNLTSNNFNCTGLKSSFRGLNEIHISFLYNTFGNNFTCLKSLLEDPKLKTLQVHLINEPGHRNKRLQSYEFLYDEGTPKDYNAKISRRDSALKQKYFNYLSPLIEILNMSIRADVELLISPGLESNLTDESGKILIEWTREIFPSARIVWNPLKSSSSSLSVSTGDLLEQHGLFPILKAPCIFNLDGSDISYPNRPALGEPQYKEGQSKNWIQSGSPMFQLHEEMANRCEYVFVWSAESNGLDYRKSAFVDPRKRNNRIPNKVYETIFSDIKNLHRRGVIYPKEYDYTPEDQSIVSSCNQIRTNFVDGFKRGNLLKQSEFRNRGAVLILSKEFSSIRSAKLYKGKTVVDTFIKNGLYKDGRILFRSNKSPTKYPLNTYLILEKNNSKICYKIPNPRIRLD